MTLLTALAGSHRLSPACVAMIVALPRPTIVAVEPEIVITLGLLLRNETGRSELEVAVSGKVLPFIKGILFNVGKLIR